MWNLPSLLFAGALALSSGQARASDISIGENQIISLANAPKVIDARAFVDVSGRGILEVGLEFSNSCAAEAGARAKLSGVDAGELTVIILQGAAGAGCPDIFQPVTRRAALLLPAANARTVRVFGRPEADGNGKRLTFENGSPDPAAAIVEIGAEDQQNVQPAAQLAGAARGPGQGYELKISISLAESCGPADVSAAVYEIPDADGAPRFDLALLSAPSRCAGSALRGLTVHVGSPQSAAGRRVLLANEAGGSAVDLP